MKKITALLLALLLLLSCAAAETAATATTAATAIVYVTISDDAGTLVMAHMPTLVIDADADGALTLADALACAHAVWHPDGGSAFAIAPSQYGMSMTRLWGIENGGSYGYCVNDVSAWSPVDPIADGDHIKAYAYTDLVAWSDAYSFFSDVAATVTIGEPVTLTLSANGYDEAWNPVTLPVAGATLTVGDASTDVVTDEAGCATLTFSEPGTYVVSAVSDTMTLVPPVCVVTVKAE